MREIKFRGKKTDNKEWVYGSLIEMDLTYIYLKTLRTGLESIFKDELTDCIVARYEIDPETIGQFTGLHDKNGKEIYEGDIVKIAIEQYGYDGSSKDYRIIKGAIEWSHMGFDIRIGTHDGKPVYSDIIQEMHLCDNIISDEWEVIGNSHENPELL